MRLVVVGAGPDGLSKVERTVEPRVDPEGEWSSEEVVLNAGDLVLIPGLAHSWRAGPDGCVLSAIMHGLAP